MTKERQTVSKSNPAYLCISNDPENFSVSISTAKKNVCLLESGTCEYKETAETKEARENAKKSARLAIIIVCVGLFLVLLAGVIWWFALRKHRVRQEEKEKAKALKLAGDQNYLSPEMTQNKKAHGGMFEEENKVEVMPRWSGLDQGDSRKEEYELQFRNRKKALASELKHLKKNYRQESGSLEENKQNEHAYVKGVRLEVPADGAGAASKPRRNNVCGQRAQWAKRGIQKVGQHQSQGGGQKVGPQSSPRWLHPAARRLGSVRELRPKQRQWGEKKPGGERQQAGRGF